MNYIYESYFKTIKGEKHFFIKKYLRLIGIGDVSDVMEGYGMHTDFKKACLIAGIKELEIQQKIFDSMEVNKAEAKVINLNSSLATMMTIAG
jgi:hypothetical protein